MREWSEIGKSRPEFSQFVFNSSTLLSLLINSFILFLWAEKSPSYSICTFRYIYIEGKTQTAFQVWVNLFFISFPKNESLMAGRTNSNNLLIVQCDLSVAKWCLPPISHSLSNLDGKPRWAVWMWWEAEDHLVLLWVFCGSSPSSSTSCLGDWET